MKDPVQFRWREVTKVAHYWPEVNAITRPIPQTVSAESSLSSVASYFALPWFTYVRPLTALRQACWAGDGWS